MTDETRGNGTDKPEDELGHLALVTEIGQRGPDDPGGVEVAGLSIGRPLVYPIHRDEVTAVLRRRSETLAVRYVGMVFIATLDELPRGRGYNAVSLKVRLDGDCRAVGLEADEEMMILFDRPDTATPLPAPAGFTALAGARPNRYARLGRAHAVDGPDGRPGRPAESRSHGLFTSEFSWAYDASGAGRLTSRSLLTHAVVEVPADLQNLSGRFSAHVGVQRSLGRFRRSQAALTRETLPFREPIRLDLPDHAGRAVRLFVAADVENYSGSLISDAERVQARLVEVMERARAATGYNIEDRQVSGDSVLFVFPPGIDEGRAIRRFYAELAIALAEINSELTPAARLRLRIGMDRGQSARADAGWSGQAVIGAGRLLNSEATKQAFTSAPESHFVLAVSESLYRDVVSEQAGPPAADTFESVQATVAGKAFSSSAWVHVAAK